MHLWIGEKIQEMSRLQVKDSALARDYPVQYVQKIDRSRSQFEDVDERNFFHFFLQSVCGEIIAEDGDVVDHLPLQSRCGWSFFLNEALRRPMTSCASVLINDGPHVAPFRGSSTYRISI